MITRSLQPISSGDWKEAYKKANKKVASLLAGNLFWHESYLKVTPKQKAKYLWESMLLSMAWLSKRSLIPAWLGAKSTQKRMDTH